MKNMETNFEQLAYNNYKLEKGTKYNKLKIVWKGKAFTRDVEK